ncbi:MAG: DciA family protein [Lysobacterales bacterium]
MTRTPRHRTVVTASIAAQAGLAPVRGDVLARLADNRRLAEALQDALPPELAGQIRFATVRQRTLVFLADTPAAASRLRLMQADLLARARHIAAIDATGVSVKVLPREAIEATLHPHVKPLSVAARRHLANAAAAMQDPDLRILLERLAGLA